MIQTFPDKKYMVEPGNVHHMSNVTKLNIANVGRTLADPPKGCTKSDLPGRYVENMIPDNHDYAKYKGKYVYPYKRDIIGNVVLVPGFNCGVTKIGTNNELNITAAKGIGYNLIEAQMPFPIYSGETIPVRSESYAGGIPCYDTVKAINGINEKVIPLTGGPGIIVEQVDENTISIEIDESQIKGKCADECGNTK